MQRLQQGRSAASSSAPNPGYDAVRALVPGTWDRGDPAHTQAAMLEIVDAPEPPLRVFLGRAPLAGVQRDYAARLATWQAWQPLSEAAF